MYCPKCGTQMEDDSVFCGHCGERLDNLIPSYYKEDAQEQAEPEPMHGPASGPMPEQGSLEPEPVYEPEPEYYEPEYEPEPEYYESEPESPWQETPDLVSKYNLQENIDNNNRNKKKKSPFLWVCLGVGIAVIAVLLVFLFVIKPKLDEKKQMEASTPVRQEETTAEETTEETTAEETTTEETTTETKENPMDHPVSMKAISSIEPSSILYEEGYSYEADMLRDHDKTTCWSEGVSGDGINEAIRFNFNSKQYITGLAIRNGFQKSNDLYNKNSRVRKLMIVDGSGNKQYIDPADTNNLQIIDLDEPVYSDSITLSIASVYRGSTYDDTCISEVEFYGSQSDKDRLEKESRTEEPTTEKASAFPRDMYVTVDELLVRTGPGTGYTAIWKLYTGDIVYVYDITNGWAHISWNGSDAYVFAQYISDKRP